MAAYPYIIASIINGLGRLTPAFAFRLLSKSWLVFLLIICLSGFVIVITATVIPISISNINSEANLANWLGLFIPSNLFKALSNNNLPAVIFFCVIFAVLLQPIQSKKHLLIFFEVISKVCLSFWQKLIKFSPIAIFVLLASTIGTIDFTDFMKIGELIGLYLFVTIILIFWIYPVLIMVVTSLSYREIFKIAGPGLIIAAATTLSIAALPLLAKEIRLWLSHIRERTTHRREEEKEVTETLLYVIYPFAQIGNYMVYIFVIFISYYFLEQIYSIKYYFLPVTSYLASIGSPSAIANALEFLLNWLSLNQEGLNIYFSIMPILRYSQVLVSVMAMFSLGLLSSYLYFYKPKLRWKLLLSNLVLLIILSISFFHYSKIIFPSENITAF
ncbi:dicarboxylate/amino acid:cation symporter [Thiotrichales bacterium 19S3-7]|nr:dicarboxylate/amino acid:cation symporter [Thiotrichales bacterium 19S3-7]MCF6802811.1 dicarboxylate/amino acid:cation symporter [Thiotrichales bacterium 19S3-11]